jgi:hypothetical protein
MGLGAGTLALSRPFEGLLVAVPVGIALLWWLVTSRKTRVGSRVLALVPAAAVVLVSLGWLGMYNARVTGSPLRMPYMAYREQYQVMPIWAWQKVREAPPGLNREMLKYAEWELAASQNQTKPLFRAKSFYRLLQFETGPVLMPALLIMLPWTVRRRWMAFAGTASVFVLGFMWASSYVETHYHAPAAGLTLILATAALRQISMIRRRRRAVWPALAALLVVGTVAVAAWEWVEYIRTPLRMMEAWSKSRAEVMETLTQQGGKHVVFVRYNPRHGVESELVYNAADIDGSPVVWVREIDHDQNDRVLTYYPDRTPWIMDIADDHRPARIEPLGFDAEPRK